MPTPTARVAAINLLAGPDLITRAAFNANFQALADLLGVIVCTSITRPSTPYPGQVIYETDTQITRVRNLANSTWTGTAAPVFECTSGTRPGSPFAGQTIYETDTLVTRVRNAANSAWVITGSIPVVNNTSDVTAPYTGQFVFELSSIALKRRSSGGAWVKYPDLTPAVDTQSTAGSTSSTSYTTTIGTGTACGVAFNAPPSGAVFINNELQLSAAAGGGLFSLCTIRLCVGGVIGSGTALVTASDTNAVQVSQNTAGATGYRRTYVSGLTPGNTYNVQQWFKVIGVNTMNNSSKELSVEMCT
jgi:hypothetical protein